MNRNNGIKVIPSSRNEIQEITFLKLRKKFGLEDCFSFPVVKFLEWGMPIIDPDFNYEIVENGIMGNVEGLTIPEINTIRIREDVYEAAMRDEGRARFTLAHEFGHYIMHKDQIYNGHTRTKEPLFDHEAYEDSEWQANTFAGVLLMPPPLIIGLSADEVMDKCKVSRSAAEYNLSKIE